MGIRPSEIRPTGNKSFGGSEGTLKIVIFAVYTLFDD